MGRDVIDGHVLEDVVGLGLSHQLADQIRPCLFVAIAQLRAELSERQFAAHRKYGRPCGSQTNSGRVGFSAARWTIAQSFSLRISDRQSTWVSAPSTPEQIFTSTSSRMWRQSLVATICGSNRRRSEHPGPRSALVQRRDRKYDLTASWNSALSRSMASRTAKNSG